AAERGAQVIGVDPAERLLEVAAATADERGLDAEFVLGDAASIPVSGNEADVVLSVFGVIFAPEHAADAAERARVDAAQGRIVIAAWIPEGAVSGAVRMIRETITDVTGQAGDPPFPWHEPPALEELFGPHGFSLEAEEHSIAITDSSPREF